MFGGPMPKPWTCLAGAVLMPNAQNTPPGRTNYLLAFHSSAILNNRLKGFAPAGGSLRVWPLMPYSVEPPATDISSCFMAIFRSYLAMSQALRQDNKRWL